MNRDEARDYVSSWLLPRMGLAGRHFTLDPPPHPGTRSSVFVLRAESMPPLLVRSFRQRRPCVRGIAALRHLETLQLPGPRLVHAEMPRRGFGLLPSTGRFLTVETFVEGTPHARLEPGRVGDATLKVARLLARFHGIVRPQWGPVDGRRIRSFGSHTLAGVRRMVRELHATGWLAEEADGLEDLFEQWRSRLDAIRRFSLVHNDANRHNVIVDEAGRITPIDLHRIAYEPFPEEVINALYHFCRKDAGLAARFEAIYFRRAGEESRKLFEETRGFFEPLNYLKKMYRRARRASPTTGDDKMHRWRERVMTLQSPPASSIRSTGSTPGET